MPRLNLDPIPHVDFERELEESSDEAFDRMDFANQALARVKPRRTTIALCTSRSRVRVETGRAWGRGEGERWAVLAIPTNASRRAIAVAVAAIAGEERSPYVLDLLMHEAVPASDAS